MKCIGYYSSGNKQPLTMTNHTTRQFLTLLLLAIVISTSILSVDANKRVKVPVHNVEKAAKALGYRIGRGIWDITGPAQDGKLSMSSS